MSTPPEPFDAAQDLLDAPRTGQRLRPQDAATLILVDTAGHRPRLLMGRRAAGHVFMASKWVFPGGRVDRADGRAASADGLSGQAAARLDAETSPYRARALALAAVRETWEETGLRFAVPAPPASVSGPWRAFRASGALPSLSRLTYVARAITPPGRTRRFDARFFMAEADGLLDRTRPEGSGELDEIAWVPLDETAALDLPAITRFVLDEVRARLDHPDRPVPFVRWWRGRHAVEPLDEVLARRR